VPIKIRMASEMTPTTVKTPATSGLFSRKDLGTAAPEFVSFEDEEAGTMAVTVTTLLPELDTKIEGLDFGAAAAGVGVAECMDGCVDDGVEDVGEAELELEDVTDEVKGSVLGVAEELELEDCDVEVMRPMIPGTKGSGTVIGNIIDRPPSPNTRPPPLSP